MARAWYALRTRWGLERRTAELLTSPVKKWRAEVPVRVQVVKPRNSRAVGRWKKEPETREYPLLARYVLIELPSPAPWFALASMPLIQGVVKIGGIPAALPRDMVENFINQSTLRAAQVVAEHLAVGTVAKITEGPLAGAVGIITERRGKRLKLAVGEWRAPIDVGENQVTAV